MKIHDSIALFGTYCICLTNVYISNRMKSVIENKEMNYVAKSKGRKQKLFKLVIRK